MRLHRNEKYFKWGLTAFLVIVASALFWIIFSNLGGFYDTFLELTSILAPVIYGCLFAYLMNPVMVRMERLMDRVLEKRNLKDTTKKRLSMTVSLVVAVLVLLLAIYAMIALIVPNLIDSLNELLQKERLDNYYTTISGWFNEWFNGSEIETWFYNNVDELLHYLTDLLKSIDISALVSGLTSSVYSIVMWVFNFFVGVIAAVYILIYKRQLCSHAKKITIAVFNTRHADRIFEVARRTNRIFGGYVMGKVIDAILVGGITYLAMIIMRMPYAPLIATIVGVTNIIPFFGPFIGAVPSGLLLLIDRPINAVYFAIFILVLQMIDGNIIENRILGEKLGISDFWVLVAILLFGGVFGFTGMLLGVPIFAVIYTLIADAVNRGLKKKRYPLNSDLYYSLNMVEDLPVDPAPSYSYVSLDPAYDMKAEPEDDELEEDNDES